MKKPLSILILAAALLISPGAGAQTIHLMGDSTCADKDLSGGNPERGWGMQFPNFLDDGIKVINYARNGRSTKSFITLGHWDEVKANLRPGDYVFIQFGHNDAKQDDSVRYAPAYGLYQDNLRMYCRTVREMGATPVLLTPVMRRWFKEGGLDLDCHGDYPAAMKQVAREMGVELLDITASSAKWLLGLGDEASRPYFMWIPEGKYAFCPEGKEDNTHTKANGARVVAGLVCDAIRNSSLDGIKPHLLSSPPDIVVAQDGRGDYMTVQEAIDAVPDYSHGVVTTIFIKEGTYKERIVIPAGKQDLVIRGAGIDRTILTYDNYARRMWPDGRFEVGTSGSASLYVHADHVTFEDLTIENSAGDGSIVGQAVALFTDGDCLFFHRCRITANQDTVYTFGTYNGSAKAKRSYYLDCLIEGTTDFIFGPGIAYFENCTILSKKDSCITAASTHEGQKYGYVFKDCRLTAAPDVTEVYLGRPWRPFARTVFIGCEMGPHIRPEGWHDWNKPGAHETAFYAEYGCTGPGAGTSGRVDWAHRLSAAQAADYTFDKVMDQGDGQAWNPFDNR